MIDKGQWREFGQDTRWHGEFVFTNSDFWKYSWAYLVMSMTESCRWVMQCRLRARRPRAFNKGLRPCPIRTEISPVSLNLLMIFFYPLQFDFFKYSTIFLRTLSQIREPLPIFTSERLCLKLNSWRAAALQSLAQTSSNSHLLGSFLWSWRPWLALCVWLGLEQICAELWPSRNWVWDQCS